MQYGFVFPFSDAPAAVETAQEVETAGWDGFFVWEPVWGVDPWVTLGAIAARTERIRIGTMITPVSRRRPWKLAGETATVDHLSNGRVILSVGLGALDTGFEEFGEETDRKTRAELLDEGLDIITGLWAGQPFNYDGKHYQIRETSFRAPPPPVQKPGIPIWVVGAWPWPKSMQRAIRFSGILPAGLGADKKWYQMTPDHIREMKAYINERRDAETPYDIVVEGTTPGDDRKAAAEKTRLWADAGATWWIEAMWSTPELKEIHRRVKQGPPRLEEYKRRAPLPPKLNGVPRLSAESR